jgi:hypothetical protein
MSDVRAQIMAILDKEHERWTKSREKEEAAGFDLSATYDAGGANALAGAMAAINAQIRPEAGKTVKLADIVAILDDEAQTLTNWAKQDDKINLPNCAQMWRNCADAVKAVKRRIEHKYA